LLCKIAPIRPQANRELLAIGCPKDNRIVIFARENGELLVYAY